MEDINPVTKVYRALPNMFVNSETMIVEYHDCIRPQWFPMLVMMAREGAMSNIFRTQMFEGLTDDELFEWYVNRPHRNMFYDIPLLYQVSDADRYAFLDSMLFKVSQIRELYGFPYYLNMDNILKMFCKNSGSSVKHIYVYEGEHHDPYIEEQVSYNFQPKTIDYLYGDFKEQIRYLNKDATYVLSDITKLSVLDELGKIPYSSILITDGWRYNYQEDDPTKLKVDIEALHKKYTCKISFFNNLYVQE